jgi:hypothetical protein
VTENSPALEDRAICESSMHSPECPDLYRAISKGHKEHCWKTMSKDKSKSEK